MKLKKIAVSTKFARILIILTKFLVSSFSFYAKYPTCHALSQVIGALNVINEKETFQKIVSFDLPWTLIKAPHQFHDTVYRELTDAAVQKTYYQVAAP